jgi:hypothetical protein
VVEKEVKEFVVPTGSGTVLSDIEPVADSVTACKDKDLLQAVHRFFFGRPGKARDMRKNIRAFSGLAGDRDDLSLKASKWPLPLLRDVMDLLLVPRGAKSFDDGKADKESMVYRFVDWAMSPSAPVKAPRKKQAKKATPAKKKRAKKAAAEDDDEEDEDEDEDEEEEEEEEEEERPKKKAKKAPKKKKAPVADDDSDDDDDDSDDDAPLWVSAARKVVRTIVAGADLNTLNMKQVRVQVSAELPGVDMGDKANKSLVKGLIMEAMSA